jgi:hypothetical protein
MFKLMFDLYRQDGLSHAEFVDYYTTVHAPLAIECHPLLSRYAVHATHPSDILFSASLGREPKPFLRDGVTSWWFENAEDFSDPKRLFASADAAKRIEVDEKKCFSRVNGYFVDEVVHWDYERDWPDETASPGVKMLYFFKRKAGLTREEFRESYLEHAAVAREHHPGLWRYVQNFVTADVTSDAPEIDAIAELHFRSEDDFLNKLYRDAEGARIIAKDVDRFMGASGTMDLATVETLVKS